MTKTADLAHDAGMDGLDADVLAVEVESVHQALGGADELVALARPAAQPQLPLQVQRHPPGLGANCDRRHLYKQSLL